MHCRIRARSRLPPTTALKGSGKMNGSTLNDPGLRGNTDRQVCVLVVEDDPALQRMILNYFGENGIRTLVANNRQEMVGQLGNAEVNLVILDLRLGSEDGLDLLREVRLSSDVPVSPLPTDSFLSAKRPTIVALIQRTL